MVYIWKEYPRTLHKWQDQTITVRDDADKAARLEEGWSIDPVLEEPIEPKRRKRKGDDA